MHSIVRSSYWKLCDSTICHDGSAQDILSASKCVGFDRIVETDSGKRIAVIDMNPLILLLRLLRSVAARITPTNPLRSRRRNQKSRRPKRELDGNRNGVERVLPLQLSAHEIRALRHSSEVLKANFAQLNLEGK